MNGVISLCSFCETHGPRIVFTTQCFRSSNDEPDTDDQKQFYGDYHQLLEYIKKLECQDPSRERCVACTSMPDAYPGFLTNDHDARISYVGSQWPYRHHIYKMVSNAAIRAVSCEYSPESSSAIFFGDDEHGHVISKNFALDDYRARGYTDHFALVIVSTDKLLLLNSFDFFEKALTHIANNLVIAAKEVFKKDQSGTSDNMMRAVGDSARAKMMPQVWLLEKTKGRQSSQIVRPLQELTGISDVFDLLHRQFMWIMRTQNNRCVELVMEGHPSQDILFAIEQQQDENEQEYYLSDDDNEKQVNSTIEEEASSKHNQKTNASFFLHDDVPSASFSTSFASSTSTLKPQLSVMLDGQQIMPEQMSLSRLMQKQSINMIESMVGTLQSYEDISALGINLGERHFRAIIAHLTIGDQICIRSNSERIVYRLIAALRALIPRGCARVFVHNAEHADSGPIAHLHCYSTNLLGVIMPMMGNLRKCSSEYTACLINVHVTSEHADRASLMQCIDRISSTCMDAVCTARYCDRQEMEKCSVKQPKIVTRYLQLLLNASMTPEVYASGVQAIKDEWMSKAKLFFQFTRQHPCAPKKNLDVLRKISACENDADEMVIKFWQKGLSKQYKQYVYTTCQALRNHGAI